MNYEKKYKEALERARQFSEHPLQEDSDSIVEYIFPELELKESEDERIRKALIHLVNSNKELSFGIDNYDGIKWSDILAWLEKQGKKKSVDDLIQQKAMDIAVAKCFDEQKPVDKVEPKFKVGDWIVSDDKDVHEDYRVCKITKIDDGRYYIEGGDFLSESSLAQYEYRLWTIQDAKDGDVLGIG